jgi:hypothetical protein
MVTYTVTIRPRKEDPSLLTAVLLGMPVSLLVAEVAMVLVVLSCYFRLVPV